MISVNQAGFISSHCTLHHAFVLRSLEEIFHSRNKKLYCAFVDFKKAFDSVWRQGLWLKISLQGITGKIYDVKVNMFSQIKSCVFVNGEKSVFFFFLWKF